MKKVGIVGFDTGHAHVFPSLIRELAKTDKRFAELAFEAGWPGDPATAVHPERLDETRAKIEGLGIRAVDDLDRLVAESDVILLESVNGDTHRELAERIVPAGKPTFIDKPFANTLDDARAIAALIEVHGAPCWHASSLRFAPPLVEAIASVPSGERQADIFGPTPRFEKGRGIVYYGVHIAEMLVTAMGPGVTDVQVSDSDGMEVVTSRWADGRLGVLRGNKQGGPFGGVIHGATTAKPFVVEGGYYEAFIPALAEFCVTGIPPVPLAETLAAMAVLEGAEQSRAAGGQVWTIA